MSAAPHLSPRQEQLPEAAESIHNNEPAVMLAGDVALNAPEPSAKTIGETFLETRTYSHEGNFWITADEFRTVSVLVSRVVQPRHPTTQQTLKATLDSYRLYAASFSNGYAKEWKNKRGLYSAINRSIAEDLRVATAEVNKFSDETSLFQKLLARQQHAGTDLTTSHAVDTDFYREAQTIILTYPGNTMTLQAKKVAEGIEYLSPTAELEAALRSTDPSDISLGLDSHAYAAEYLQVQLHIMRAIQTLGMTYERGGIKNKHRKIALHNKIGSLLKAHEHSLRQMNHDTSALALFEGADVVLVSAIYALQDFAPRAPYVQIIQQYLNAARAKRGMTVESVEDVAFRYQHKVAAQAQERRLAKLAGRNALQTIAGSGVDEQAKQTANAAEGVYVAHVQAFRFGREKLPAPMAHGPQSLWRKLITHKLPRMDQTLSQQDAFSVVQSLYGLLSMAVMPPSEIQAFLETESERWKQYNDARSAVPVQYRAEPIRSVAQDIDIIRQNWPTISKIAQVNALTLTQLATIKAMIGFKDKK